MTMISRVSALVAACAVVTMIGCGGGTSSSSVLSYHGPGPYPSPSMRPSPSPNPSPSVKPSPSPNPSIAPACVAAPESGSTQTVGLNLTGETACTDSTYHSVLAFFAGSTKQTTSQ